MTEKIQVQVVDLKPRSAEAKKTPVTCTLGIFNNQKYLLGGALFSKAQRQEGSSYNSSVSSSSSLPTYLTYLSFTSSIAMRLATAILLLPSAGAFIYPHTRIQPLDTSCAKKQLAESSSAKIQNDGYSIGSFVRKSVPFALKASSESPVETDDNDKETLLAEINELTKSFEDVQANITRLYERKLEEYEDNMIALKKEIDAQINGMEKKDSEIAKLKVIMDNAQAQAKDLQEKEKMLSESEKKMDGLLTEMKQLKMDSDQKVKELKSKEQEVKVLTSSSSAAEQKNKSLTTRIQDLEKLLLEKKALEGQVAKYDREMKSIEKSVDSQKGIVIAKDEEIERLKSSMTKNEEQLKGGQGKWSQEKDTLAAERNDLLKEKEAIQRELEAALPKAEAMQKTFKKQIKELEERLEITNDTKLRREIIDVQAKSYKELMDVRLKMDSTEQKAEQEILDLLARCEEYEAERRSLRKLTVLGLKRFGSFFRLRRQKKEEDPSVTE